MSDQNIHIEITRQSVSATLNVRGKARFHALAIYAGMTVLCICALLFLPGKNGDPGMWHDLSISGAGSTDFLLVNLCILLSFPVLMFGLTERYVRLAFPSNETFRCDGLTLSTARVHWFDAHNGRWKSRSFPLANVQCIRYCRVANLRGSTIYGIRLKAQSKTRRLLPGLKPDEAEKLLLALRSFGADVPDNPVIPAKLRAVQSL